MLSYNPLITNVINKQDATFYSDPPYEFSWVKAGSLLVAGVNWGNADNQVVATVQWGDPLEGYESADYTSYVRWIDDATLTVTIDGSGGVAVRDVDFIQIDKLKTPMFRVKYVLSGTSQEVDIETRLYVQDTHLR